MFSYIFFIYNKMDQTLTVLSTQFFGGLFKLSTYLSKHTNLYELFRKIIDISCYNLV